MSKKRMLLLSSLVALTLVWLTAPYAFGCIPDDVDPSRCIQPPKSSLPSRTTVAAHTVPPVAAAKPSGLNPDQAMEPDGEWRYIQGNSSLWYKVTDSRLQLEIWVDANGQSGIALAIYAPDQKDLYGTPVGRGSPNQNEHRDLFWTGRSRAWGTWYAVVTNYNPYPVNYSLFYKRVAKSTKDYCAVCHGYEINFDDCEDQGDGFCGSLEGDYR